MKKLIRVPLTELRTYDEEVLGTLAEPSSNGKIYRWVKNAGSTGLVGDGCCLTLLTSVEAAQFKRVINPDTTGVTAAQELPAGVPMTAIGPSGSDTGDHGWIQVKGPREVYQMGSDTAYAVGGMAVATDVQPATAPWAVPTAAISADSATEGFLYQKRVVTIQALATAGAATATKAMVDIQCL